MKFFKYLFFLIVLIFVVGSLYIATISIPKTETLVFQTPVNPELYKSKIQDLSSYKRWFEFPQKPISEKRLSNAKRPKQSILSWQNEKFEAINLQNKSLTADSITQQLTLKTWLSSSEFDISWNFETSEENSKIVVHLKSDASFWQKTESVVTGTTHLEQTKAAISQSIASLEESILEEISAYDITPIGKVDIGGFFLLHATSAARLNFKTILKKSDPIFENVEQFMRQQNFEASRGRVILFENLFEDTNNLIFSAGIGSENQIAIPDNFEVLSKYVRGGSYFKTQLTGDYINLGELLAIGQSTIKNRELNVNMFLKPFLEFEVNQTDTINPAQWKTNLYLPILEN